MLPTERQTERDTQEIPPAATTAAAAFCCLLLLLRGNSLEAPPRVLRGAPHHQREPLGLRGARRGEETAE